MSAVQCAYNFYHHFKIYGWLVAKVICGIFVRKTKRQIKAGISAGVTAANDNKFDRPANGNACEF